ncbi:MFS transporter [Candidatus Tisiphia endosymbiont of Oplodontha viridula]|uniref:MFS transporter n=1 Tax=Candidatus Tisiphia endosymbiont of Oplodontha viridula TaxID=3077925 RepID=UPI0035C8923D
MNKRKLVFASGIANAFEWYDYALFGLFAPIIGEKFFPGSNPNSSLLHAFLAFAIGYLMRPIGGVFFGVLGDRFGRKIALSTSIFCMSLPTALIGVLPTYDDIGITSTILMILVRMLQGLSMGGALTGSISFVIEHTGIAYRGFSSSVSMSSICIGLLFGSGISQCIQSLLSAEQFDDWGWRIPFLLGILIFFAGLYIKKYTSETPSFQNMKEKGKILKSPLKQVISVYWFDMIISIVINSTGSVLFYLQTIYLMSFLRMNRGFTDDEVSNLANYCYIIMAIVTLCSGYLSDIIGRKKIFVINLLVIILVTPFLMQVIETGDFYLIIISQIILSILAACYIGPEPALQAEFYPTNIRNTALSLSYNIATSIFGGTTPLVIAYLVQKTGTITSAIYYIIACAIASLIALYFYKDRSRI